ncbi:DUF1684 domain-containing protein [Deinococcus peraridilitoris]|uniref:DUF1684 domain-containing protein n=1 Tax=Deinococcus peraridilitoris (strain DSM 19664 / LMG 22246 / CIP 109416 / KR-200) TaxID=937777 RepID=L0A556_DEIPD|nr:DUF1684 domain-containing protein [Deinococcus peraridilitoris]AFZ69001.1 Protein of unknown function (DUF1684) [Deinococcus peraridilitoris DSM 19664]
MNDYVSEVLDHRRTKDDFFRTRQSPLSERTRNDFAGLAYYPPDPAYRLITSLALAHGEETELLTSTGELQTYALYATAHVQLPEGGAELYLYAPPGERAPTQLFVPFRDATSGKETYGAGRYVEAQVQGDQVLLDFNFAYHPYCAYSEGWSCPLPPQANWLDFPVRAGERNLL